MKHVLVSPLSWGLGHATRDLPIIRYLLERGHHVTIAAVDRALTLLQHEVPECDFERMPDYPPPYSSGRHFVPKFVALGKPEVKETHAIDDRIEVHGFLDRARQQEMLNRARLVVCRSGYTTVMELAELGRNALFIPTPGQTEQVYLANYYEERGWFHTVDQYELDLPRDIEKAKTYTGPPFPNDTQANVERLYADLFAPVLEA